MLRLEVRVLAELQGEMQRAQRRVSDAMLRSEAEQQFLAQSNSCMWPISHTLMRELVIAADGHTYERVEIEKWIRLKGGSVKSKTNDSFLFFFD